MKKIDFDGEMFVWSNTSEKEKCIYYLQKEYSYSLEESEKYYERLRNILDNYSQYACGLKDNVDTILMFESLSENENGVLLFVRVYLIALFEQNKRKVK